MSKEIEEKTERLLRLMSQARLGGLLINSQANFSWLTAGGRNGIDLSRENGAGTLFLRPDGKRFVLASKIEMGRLLTEELDDQVEETCIAFEDGIEIITATPGWPTIPVEVEGRPYLLPSVLSL